MTAHEQLELAAIRMRFFRADPRDELRARWANWESRPTEPDFGGLRRLSLALLAELAQEEMAMRGLAS